ncbi:hypothetical protein VTN96DRAFT_4283 [Rasamsonia emersonii]
MLVDAAAATRAVRFPVSWSAEASEVSPYFHQLLTRRRTAWRQACGGLLHRLFLAVVVVLSELLNAFLSVGSSTPTLLRTAGRPLAAAIAAAAAAALWLALVRRSTTPRVPVVDIASSAG